MGDYFSLHFFQTLTEMGYDVSDLYCVSLNLIQTVIESNDEVEVVSPISGLTMRVLIGNSFVVCSFF